MELLLIWLLLCVAVCVLAARYQRSVAGWFVLSVVLSPLVGIVLLALGHARASVAVPEPEAGLPSWAEGMLDPSTREQLVRHRRLMARE